MKSFLVLIVGLIGSLLSLHAQNSVSGNVKSEENVPYKGVPYYLFRPIRWPEEALLIKREISC
ncbi:MAG: hypothetical protein LUE99_01185 [Bacteroides sp.]|nr:hypothetical protein [Bacteroides sp.]